MMDFEEASQEVYMQFNFINNEHSYELKENGSKKLLRKRDEIMVLLQEGEKYKKMWEYLSNMKMSGELKEVMNNIENMF